MNSNQNEAQLNGFDQAKANIFVPSIPIPAETISINGPDFNNELDLNQLMESYQKIGFQATSLYQSIEIINKMRKWRLSDDDPTITPNSPQDEKTKIFLGFTSNLISSGLREIIKFLTEHSYISVLVTTAGGIEEDLIKCLGSTYLSSFDQNSGSSLRKSGLNRIGNLIVPNENYCKFEDWVIPILNQMRDEQINQGVHWTPSKVIERLGLEINDTSSVLYWAAKNKIPVFCPALTDGSFGDMLCFHSIKMDPDPIRIDIVEDIRSINELGRSAKKAGMIILGGGVCKHQIANAMLYRNGAEYAVYINTGQEFDGSDSGARPDEAISWGKIKMDSESVKVFADATLVFPLIVAATWGKDHVKNQESKKSKKSDDTKFDVKQNSE